MQPNESERSVKELLEVIGEFWLAFNQLRPRQLSLPLGHCLVNDYSDVVVELFPSKIGVVHRCIIESVVQERVKVRSETRSNKLDISALDGHHERSDACMREHIVFEVLDCHKLIKGVNVTRAAREVNSSAPVVVRLVDIRAKSNDLNNVGTSAFTCYQHQRRDVSVLNRLIDRQQLLKYLDYGVYLALVDRSHDNRLCAKTLTVTIFNHF